jgi:hypothetical protein
MRSERLARTGSWLFWFIANAFAALVVGGITSVMLAGAAENFLENLPPRYQSLARPLNWYGPYVCAVGLCLGFIANRNMLKRVACWVWAVGVAWLAAGIWDSTRGYDPHFSQGCSAAENVVNAFFVLNGRKCGGGGSTLAGVFFTMPALSSGAYAVGAWVAMGLKKRRSE